MAGVWSDLVVELHLLSKLALDIDLGLELFELVLGVCVGIVDDVGLGPELGLGGGVEVEWCWSWCWN